MLTTKASQANEIGDFATSLRRLLETTSTPDRWTADAPADDRTAALTDQLSAIGWFDVLADAETAAFVGPAALELGRAVAPVSTIDAALRAAVGVSVARPGESVLVRYPSTDGAVLWCSPQGVVAATISAAQPVNYLDAWAVHAVDLGPAAATADPSTFGQPQDWQAWLTAMTGYLTGLVVGAHELALDHVRTRVAFGRPLIENESVANKMADVLTTVEGLRMASTQSGTLNTLRYAGPAAVAAMAHCHQVLGAIGFTIEFPLQRYSRRATALAAWNDSVLDALVAQQQTSNAAVAAP